MSAHLDDIQAALVDLARRPDGISAIEAGQLIEAREPLERTEPSFNEETGQFEQIREPGVVGIEARGRRRLRNLSALGWLTYDESDEVWRVGGGSRSGQRLQRPARTAGPARRGGVVA